MKKRKPKVKIFKPGEAQAIVAKAWREGWAKKSKKRIKRKQSK